MKVKSKIIKINFIFPFFLISFTFLTLYSFIFGDNGFIVHKQKIKKITQLEKENKNLSEQINHYKNKIAKIKQGDLTAIETEARKIPLQKNGELIIKVINESWIEQLAHMYEKQSQQRKIIPQESFSFAGHYKMILGVIFSLLIAFLITLLLPLKKKEGENPSSEIG